MKSDFSVSKCSAVLIIWMLLWLKEGVEGSLNSRPASLSRHRRGLSSLASHRDFTLASPVLPDPVNVPSFEDSSDEESSMLIGKHPSSGLLINIPKKVAVEFTTMKLAKSNYKPAAILSSVKKVNVWAGERKSQELRRKPAVNAAQAQSKQSDNKPVLPLVVGPLSPAVQAMRKLDFVDTSSQVGVSPSSMSFLEHPALEWSNTYLRSETLMQSEESMPTCIQDKPLPNKKQPIHPPNADSRHDVLAPIEQPPIEIQPKVLKKRSQRKSKLPKKSKPMVNEEQTSPSLKPPSNATQLHPDAITTVPKKTDHGKLKKSKKNRQPKSRTIVALKTVAGLEPEAINRTAGRQRKILITTHKGEHKSKNMTLQSAKKTKGKKLKETSIATLKDEHKSKNKALKPTKKTKGKKLSIAIPTRPQKIESPPPLQPAKAQDMQPGTDSKPTSRHHRHGNLKRIPSDLNKLRDSAPHSIISGFSQQSSDSEAETLHQMSESSQQPVKIDFSLNSKDKNYLKYCSSDESSLDLFVCHRKVKGRQRRNPKAVSRIRGIPALYPIPKLANSKIVLIDSSSSSDQDSNQVSVTKLREHRLYARWVENFPTNIFLDSIVWRSEDSSSSSSEQFFSFANLSGDENCLCKKPSCATTVSPLSPQISDYLLSFTILGLNDLLGSHTARNSGKASDYAAANLWESNKNIAAHIPDSDSPPPLARLCLAFAWCNAQTDLLLDDSRESLVFKNRRSLLSFFLLVLVWIARTMILVVSIDSDDVLFFRKRAILHNASFKARIASRLEKTTRLQNASIVA